MSIEIDFLEFLEPTDGVTKQIDVFSFIYKHFDKPKDLKENVDNESDTAKLFLLNLCNRELIIPVDAGALVHICNKSWTTPKDGIRYQMWFDELEVLVALTPQGQTYLNEERVKNILSETNKSIQLSNRSTVETNDLVKLNIKVQIGMGIITLLAIVSTAIVSLATYWKDDSPSLLMISKSMQRQEQLLDSIRLLQKERNTYLKTMAKKTSQRTR
ncbi:MAG TPA: hypothetical protein VL442_21635 [Mucilaginibacter sp.]|jgi:hypothetical protein|nr:hypothetical protein [Mucilaginibacter sp.]